MIIQPLDCHVCIKIGWEKPPGKPKDVGIFVKGK
jgi:hypothetical protein